MTPTVHIGLPDAAAASLQKLFAATEGLVQLGGGCPDLELNALAAVIVRPSDWMPTTTREAMEAAMAAGEGPAVLSNADLTSWRAWHPGQGGKRLKQLFGKPKLLVMTRRPADWVKAHYISRLQLLRYDAFAGLNPWTEKHMSQLKIGSELAQVRLTETIREIAAPSGADEILVLPAEMLAHNREAFGKAVDDFIGLEGRFIAAVAQSQENGADPPADKVELAAARTLGLWRRQRERFMEYMALFESRGGPSIKKRYQEVINNPEATQADWIQWFWTARIGLRKSLANGDPDLLAALPEYDDYELRSGLADYLGEIEAAETESLREEFGADLRPYGYGAPAAVTA